MSVMPRRRWNHNIHYHRLIVNAIPSAASTALDIGCGEGTLCRTLRAHVRHVTGLDTDPASIAAARAAGGDIDYYLGDFLTHPFDLASFDVITSVAALHHLDHEAALRRIQELLRPGGTLTIIGVARRSLTDAPYDAAGFIAHRILTRRHGYWQHPSPTLQPTQTHRQLRRTYATLLPGARYRRHILFRYSLHWRKP
jgi:2-polyprenyl-3-methyl-5-hydroxy-6-metoxy-1,4-benzoquinol methylase